jgi:hypothetical protein
VGRQSWTAGTTHLLFVLNLTMAADVGPFSLVISSINLPKHLTVSSLAYLYLLT